VEVPVNSDAQVVIPSGEAMTEVTIREGGHVIWEKGHFVPGTPGISGGKEERGRFIFDVGSGRYAFRLRGE
jgi:uncharacterized protein GlcG (DUF336 family)